MVRERTPEMLDGWLKEASKSEPPELRNFAVSLRRDEAAVRAAVSMPWSSGQVEGQIHRLKLIKRQGYGRASFELLKRRVVVGAA
jgi:transposase